MTDQTRTELILQAVDVKFAGLIARLDAFEKAVDIKIAGGMSDIKVEAYRLAADAQQAMHEVTTLAKAVKDGTDGADGADGKDADEDAIVERVMKAMPDPVPGPQGEAGDKGDKGDCGKSIGLGEVSKIVFDAVDAKVEELLPGMIPDPVKGDKGDQGEPGAPGASVDVDKLKLTLVNHIDEVVPAMIPEPVAGAKGEKGDPGVDGVNGADAEVDTDDLFDMVKRGVAFYQTDIVDSLKAHIPDPVVGPKGDTGDQGDPGVKGDQGDQGDAPDRKTLHKLVQETIDEVTDDIVAGLKTHIPAPLKGDKGDPGAAAPAPTDLQLADALRALWPDIRALVVREMPHMLHRGTYASDAHETYIVGDEVAWNGSSYRMLEKTDEAPPGMGWQMISQGKPGKKGVRGESGPKGADGRGLKQTLTEGATLIFEYDDGGVDTHDLSDEIAKMIADFMNGKDQDHGA